MNYRIRSILFAFLFVVACFVLIECKGDRKKGYNVHYVVQVSPDESSVMPMEELVNQSLIVIKNRLNASGFQFSIKQAGPDLIDVLVTADSTGILSTRQLVEASNKLEFREVYMLSELAQSVGCADKAFYESLPIDTTAGHPANNNHLGSFIAFSVDAKGQILDNGIIGRTTLIDTGLVTKILNDPKVHKCFPEDIQFCYGPPENIDRASDKKGYCGIYAIKTYGRKAPLTNQDIKHAEPVWTYDRKPSLAIEFTQWGGKIFANMTMMNKGRFIAIVLDKKVISAPHVESEVEGGKASIHGNFTEDETKMLAHQLNAGYLSARLHLLLQELVPEKASSSN